ncbi:MAG: Hpt domain-containing protein [Pirellulaceae bacterium]
MIDWSDALDRMGGDEGLLVEVIEAFQQETPQVMDDLRRAWKTHDASLLHRSAHTLKNSLLTLGATASSETAFALELLARNNQLLRADPLLATLESQLPEVCEELAQFVRAKRAEERK